MAASSPAPISNTADSSLTPAAAVVSSGSQPKTVRHVNRPKCIQCGNLARSRCPYQSCKSCCSKAQNPCHIHVLKANPTTPDNKVPAEIIISFNQAASSLATWFVEFPANCPIADRFVSTFNPSFQHPCSINTNILSLLLIYNDSLRIFFFPSSLRVASLGQQLSNSFPQLNNAQTPRSRKPPMTKEAVAINQWRFSKLRERTERTLEQQNEAYERYMQNIRLLEEAFSMKLMQGRSSSQYVTSTNSEIAAKKKKRKQQIVDELLKKLEEWDQLRRSRPEKAKTWSTQTASTSKNEADKRKGSPDISNSVFPY
ncbi:hypothetical protein LINGRAHAP2_LOCUS3670 [Linum grandiflorum]